VILTVVLKLLLTVYLVVAAVLDFRTRQVPNWLTLPALVAVAVWRVWQLQFVFLLFWAGCVAAWLLNVLGGGDVKLLMVLFGVFPRVELFFLLLAVAGVSIAVVLLVRYARIPHGLRLLFKRTLYRLSRLQFFPSRAEAKMAAEPFTIFIAMAGVAYAWFFF
jgi:Flp pilus assembly protein protease CpaA